MKLFTFEHSNGAQHMGVVLPDDSSIDFTSLCAQGHIPAFAGKAPANVQDFVDSQAAGDTALHELTALAPETIASFRVDLQALSLLAPIPRPRKNIFCVGRNYREHIIEGNIARGRDLNDFPKAAEFFTKPPTAVVGHGASVSSYASITPMLDYEVELGIVIGKAGKNIRAEDAMEHVLGFTVINDITARDLQTRHGQWFKGKGLDGTCPIGPVIALKSSIANPAALQIELSVNGERRQNSNTSDLLFSIADIIHQLSQGLTLEPGDMIATGTPSGVGLGLNPPRFLKPGDIISARIEGIGELRNQIVEEAAIP